MCPGPVQASLAPGLRLDHSHGQGPVFTRFAQQTSAPIRRRVLWGIKAPARRGRAVPQAVSSGSEFLSNPVHEELHPATTRANVNVKALAIDEQLSKLAHQSPSRALVELPGADVVEGRGAPGTTQRVCRGRGWTARCGGQLSALPTRIELVVVLLSAFWACPHKIQGARFLTLKTRPGAQRIWHPCLVERARCPPSLRGRVEWGVKVGSCHDFGGWGLAGL